MKLSKIGKYSLNKIKPCKRIWEDIEGNKGEDKKTFLTYLKNVKKNKKKKTMKEMEEIVLYLKISFTLVSPLYF